MVKPPRICYVKIEDCFPFAGVNDLTTVLRRMTTQDIILRPSYVLSLVVPYDRRESWELAVNFAVNLRNISSDYRMSLTKYKRITQQNSARKFGYVSYIITITINPY